MSPQQTVLRAARWLKKNAYLAVVVAMAFVVTQTVEFSPPPQVRIDPGRAGVLVGDALQQDFTGDLGNPQAVQLRATLRLYDGVSGDLLRADPETDERAQLLSQPVVTTILGMNASVEQTVRLENGDLEVDLSLLGTPRLAEGRARRGQRDLQLEHELAITSRRSTFWSSTPQTRTHVASRGTLTKLTQRPHRVVFSVDQHLFTLDVELHRQN